MKSKRIIKYNLITCTLSLMIFSASFFLINFNSYIVNVILNLIVIGIILFFNRYLLKRLDLLKSKHFLKYNENKLILIYMIIVIYEPVVVKMIFYLADDGIGLIFIAFYIFIVEFIIFIGTYIYSIICLFFSFEYKKFKLNNSKSSQSLEGKEEELKERKSLKKSTRILFYQIILQIIYILNLCFLLYYKACTIQVRYAEAISHSYRFLNLHTSPYDLFILTGIIQLILIPGMIWLFLMNMNFKNMRLKNYIKIILFFMYILLLLTIAIVFLKSGDIIIEAMFNITL